MRNCHFARSSKPHEGPAICKLGNTFMLSIDWVLEIVHGPLTCHLVKCSMDWASSAVVCPFSLSNFKLLIFLTLLLTEYS